MIKKYGILFMLCVCLAISISTAGAEEYEAAFSYINNYPYDKRPGWHPNCQGITHDESHWFITRDAKMFRIPETHDLSLHVNSNPDVVELSITDVSDLSGYNHFGDLTHYEFEEHHYLVVPVTGEGVIPVMAIFESVDEPNAFIYKGKYMLSGLGNVGWCAIDPQGYLYTSDSPLNYIVKYKIIWGDVATNTVTFIKQTPNIQLKNENGVGLMIENMQGGVFSDSGSLLFLVSGYYDSHYAEEGINVIDTATWKRIRRSKSNNIICIEPCSDPYTPSCCLNWVDDTCGGDPFCYEFHPGGLFENREEPEGITYWDLDDGNAPNISGQLHVLMVDQEASDDDDSVYLKHYTSKVYVNCATGTGSKGEKEDPFGTVSEALNFAWDGAKIALEPYNCPESLTADKKVQFISTGGTAAIGDN